MKEMCDPIQVEKTGSLKVPIDRTIYSLTKRARAWYVNSIMSVIAPIILALIDIVGFYIITKTTFNSEPWQKIVTVSALAVAFEVAPLYIGYGLCLKCNELGKPIHNWVLSFATSACLLGVIANTVFRFMTQNMLYPDNTRLALAVAILMSILPVVTSLVNLVIGCLAFDPLLMDLRRISKKLAKLKAQRRTIKAHIEELSEDAQLKSMQQKSENVYYAAGKDQIKASKARLYQYIAARVSISYEEKE